MNTFVAEHGKKRLFIVSTCISILLLLVETVLLANLYNTITYKGSSLILQKLDSSHIIMVDREDHELVVDIQLVLVNDAFIKTYTIEYMTDEIKYESQLGTDSLYTFTDGSVLSVPFILFGQLEEDSLTALQKSEKALVDRLLSYSYDYIDMGFFFTYFFFGMLALLFANTQYHYPEKRWRLSTSLFIHGGELTEFYFFIMKLSAVFFAASVYGLLLYFVMRYR